MAEKGLPTDCVPHLPERIVSQLPSTAGWHPRLENPTTQIRLIRLHPGHIEDDLRLDLFCSDRKNTVPYIAISYTWGEDTGRKTVYINGCPQEVWPNCHYALWQVRLHYPGSYVWIDSICIQQSNIDEKSHQVAMMGKVYESATLTCASIGPPACYSGLLAEFFQRLSHMAIKGRDDSANASARAEIDRVNEETTREFVKQWFMPDRETEKLLSALYEVLDRPYWNRMWIVQELMLSQSVSVLYGTDTTSWQDIGKLSLLTDVELDDPRLSGKTFLDDERYRIVDSLTVMTKNRSASFVNMMEHLGLPECSDIRDRIFAILGVIKWPGSGIPIAPDYNKTVLDLAINATPYMSPFWNLGFMLRTLELTFHTDNMPALIRCRQQITSVPFDSFPNLFSGNFTSFPSVSCLEVTADAIGRLRCSMQRRKMRDYEAQSNLRAGLLQKMVELNKGRHARYGSTDSVKGFVGGKPCPIYFEDEVAALGSCGLQDRDQIAIMSFYGYGVEGFPSADTFLILRLTSQKWYELIGQGFMLPGYEVCSLLNMDDEGKWFNVCPCRQVGMEHKVQTNELVTELTNEDLVVLVGQDMLPAGERKAILGGTFDVDARFMRLSTRATEQASSHCLLFSWPESFEKYIATKGCPTQTSKSAEVDDTGEV